MSKGHDQGRSPSPWSTVQHTNSQNGPLGIYTDTDPSRLQNQSSSSGQSRSPYSAPPTSANRLPDRANVPTRSSTTGSSDPDRNLANNTSIPHARSEDLSHGTSTALVGGPYPGSSPRLSPVGVPSPGSRPSTPAGSTKPDRPSTSGHSDDLNRRTSVASFSSANSGSSSHSGPPKAPPTSSSSTSTSLSAT